MITWFSVTHESIDDPRFSFIANNLADLGVRTSDVLAMWLRLMHHASKQIDNFQDAGQNITDSHVTVTPCHVTSRGSVTGRDMAILAYSLGIEKVTAESIFSAMLDCKIIINDRFPDWENNQPKGSKSGVAKTDAERKRNQREREKQKKLENMSRNVTESHDVTTDNNRKEYINKNIIKKKLTENEFEEFWKCYGKGNRQKALKAFMKIKGIDYPAIAEGLKKYQDHCATIGREPKFMMDASTWLNNRGWEDEHLTKSIETKPPERTAEEVLMHKLGCIHFETTLNGRFVEAAKLKFKEDWEKENNQKVTWFTCEDWKKLKVIA